jgi:hypothetical protein
MSQAILAAVRWTVVRTIQGFALGAAIGGLDACGTENTNEGPEGLRVSQSSIDTDQTSLNGQSGTEYDQGGGGDRPSCPCGFLTNPLRGTVLEVVNHIEGADGRPVRLGTVRVRVDELLGSTSGLEIGSEITAPWFGELPCFFGCASVAVGDQVLAFYRFPEPCITTPGVECALGDTIPGRIALTPWSDTVVLAQLVSGEFTLAVEDLPLLESPECAAQIGSVGNRLGPNDSETACYERVSPAP